MNFYRVGDKNIYIYKQIKLLEFIMKLKLFIGFLAMLGLCGSICAQMIMPRADESNAEFCKKHLQLPMLMVTAVDNIFLYLP